MEPDPTYESLWVYDHFHTVPVPTREVTYGAAWTLYRVVHRSEASGAEAVLMDSGHSYDYEAQEWVRGHDHAHRSPFRGEPLMFCGADVATCEGLEK